MEEIKRILKPEGQLLVLEWERPKSLWQRFLFFPLKVLEPNPFPTFYQLDKQQYFKEHGYMTVKQYHCDYTTVLELQVLD